MNYTLEGFARKSVVCRFLSRTDLYLPFSPIWPTGDEKRDAL